METLEAQTATTFGHPSSLLFASDSQTLLGDTPTETAKETSTQEDTFVSNGLLFQEFSSTLSQAGPSRIPEDGAFGGTYALFCGGSTLRTQNCTEGLRVWSYGHSIKTRCEPLLEYRRSRGRLTMTARLSGRTSLLAHMHGGRSTLCCDLLTPLCRCTTTVRWPRPFTERILPISVPVSRYFAAPYFRQGHRSLTRSPR